MRVGLLGAGDMGSTHAAAWARVDGVELVSVLARSEPSAKRLAERYGARACTDPRAILDDASVDAVDVTLPTALHGEFVTAALARGKHVFCETPLAASAAEAEPMLAAARSSGRLLQVALLSRVAQPGVEIRRRLRAGEFGRPQVVSCERLWPGLGTAAKDHHGDALEELALFDVDYLLFCFGLPRSVSAVATRSAGVEGASVPHVMVALEFEAVQAFVEASRILPASFTFRIAARFVCEQGTLEWILRFPPSGPPMVEVTSYGTAGEPEAVRSPEENPYEAECRHFAQVVRGKADPALLAGAAALDGLRVLDAARRSLVERRPVTL